MEVYIMAFKRVGRPARAYKTIAKTYMFFEEDIKFLQRTGRTPKEVMRLGVLSVQNNPQLITRIREVEENNTSLQEKLNRYVTKYLELQEEIKRVKNV